MGSLDRGRLLLGLAFAGLLLATPVMPEWLTFLLAVALARGLVVQGVVLQMRTGLVSFGQGLYYCVGAYAVGMGASLYGLTDGLALLGLGLLVSVLLALAVGLLLTRYREIFFAMLSMAVSMILYGALVKSQALGSTDGFNVPPVSYLGLHPTAEFQKTASYLLTVVVAGAVALLLDRLQRASVGLVSEGVMENEIRVEYLGLSPRAVLHANYVIAAAVSALGGGLMALSTRHVDPEAAFWVTSGEFVFVALLGGTAHVAAPFVASILFAFGRTYAMQFAPNAWQLILGLVLLTVMLFLPSGLWSLVARRRTEAAP